MEHNDLNLCSLPVRNFTPQLTQKNFLLLSVLPVAPAGFVGSIWVMDSRESLPVYHLLRAQTFREWIRSCRSRISSAPGVGGFSSGILSAELCEHPCLDGRCCTSFLVEQLPLALPARAPGFLSLLYSRLTTRHDLPTEPQLPF